MGLELIDQATKKIRINWDKLEVSQGHQQNCYDPKHKIIEFEDDDFIFLKVRPIKGIPKFVQEGKWSPRYIRPFEIIEKVGKVTYKLALPLDMFDIYNIFHVSILKR